MVRAFRPAAARFSFTSLRTLSARSGRFVPSVAFVVLLVVGASVVDIFVVVSVVVVVSFAVVVVFFVVLVFFTVVIVVVFFAVVVVVVVVVVVEVIVVVVGLVFVVRIISSVVVEESLRSPVAGGMVVPGDGEVLPVSKGKSRSSKGKLF
jgi:hypothetical protein